MSDLQIGVTNHEQAGTELVGDPDEGGNFGNDYILRVVRADGLFTVGPIDGLQALVRDGRGVHGHSIENDGVVGTSDANDKSGVVGINDNNVGVFGRGNAHVGVLGNSSGGNGVEGDSAGGVGVLGRSNSGNGVVGLSDSDSGVSGMSNSGVGVRGGSESNDGVVGTSDATNRSGVVGLNTNNVGVFGLGKTAIVGEGQGLGATGVFGEAQLGAGVRGFSNGGFGVVGEGGGGGPGIAVGVAGDVRDGYGVQATSDKNIGILAACGDDDNPGIAAGVFVGDVIVEGNFTVLFGVKSAAIPHRDGSHRRLYSMESPESWFEDFGEARLVKGRANVKLESGFLSVVKMDRYHVFLTPYGESNGLYVSRRSKKGFEVREQSRGKSNVSFSYRIVAKRADIDARRFAKVKLPRPRLVRPQATPKPRHIERPPRPKYRSGASR
jgi:hypothetical protein